MDESRPSKFKYPAEIRIKGLAIGVEFKRRGYAEEIGAELRKAVC